KSKAGNRETLMGGAGIDFVQAGNGDDDLYAYFEPRIWAQAQKVAADHGVRLGERDNPLKDPLELFKYLVTRLDETGKQIIDLQELKKRQPLTPAQELLLKKLADEDQQLSYTRV